MRSRAIEDAEQLELLYIAGGNAKWYTLENSLTVLIKLNVAYIREHSAERLGASQ
jgi:hypothetical protein